MNIDQMSDLLTKISDRVQGKDIGISNGTAPVTLQIGFVNEICMHDGIVITDAPSAIIEVVNDWVAKENARNAGRLVSASAGFGGLLIR